LIKAGTVNELSQYEGKIDRGVYRVAMRIVTMLDEVYGADRDVDNNDGGFVLIVENVEDLSFVEQRYVRLDANQHEAVDIVKCENRAYINALFLCNTEFGINVIMPMNIAPQVLLRDIPQKSSHSKGRN
jgi:hypothetical protein